MNDIVKYETSYGEIALDGDTVRKYLTRGNSPLNDNEVMMFLMLCKSQRLNPFIGEAYAIKFGSEFQMIVGYDTYKRRAEQNPNYRGRKSGIVVQRGNDIVLKEGTCLYPGEALIGGWCRVYRTFQDTMMEEYKEVSLAEYDKHISNWKTKPATMIEKVAVSQALRAAFPTDFTGLYTAPEMGADEPKRINITDEAEERTVATLEEPKASHQELLELFATAKDVYGEKANENLKRLMKTIGFEGESSRDLTGTQVQSITDLMMVERSTGHESVSM